MLLLLNKLKEEGFAIYIWTARDKLCTHKILKNLEIFELFEGICCGDETAPKPSAEGLEAPRWGVFQKKIFLLLAIAKQIFKALNPLGVEL